MRDVQRILREHGELKDVVEELNSAVLDGVGQDMYEDLEWRASHTGVDMTYWALVSSDFQRQLSDGYTVHVDPLASKLSYARVERQAVSKIPEYDGVQIVRYPFRCFHRSDGALKP